YSVGSYSLSYTAGGAFTVYGGTSPKTWGEVQDLIKKEFASFRSDGPTQDEVDKAKMSLCGSMILGLEGMSSRMMRMSRNELVRGRDVPIEEVTQKIKAVTRDQVTELARTILAEDRLSTTVIGPGKA